MSRLLRLTSAVNGNALYLHPNQVWQVADMGTEATVITTGGGSRMVKESAEDVARLVDESTTPDTTAIEAAIADLVDAVNEIRRAIQTASRS